MIQQERERLKKLQEQWREKLRQAEIDLSLEQRSSPGNAPNWKRRPERPRMMPGRYSRSGEQDRQNAEQPARGRWLARLGLTERGRRTQQAALA